MYSAWTIDPPETGTLRATGGAADECRTALEQSQCERYELFVGRTLGELHAVPSGRIITAVAPTHFAVTLWLKCQETVRPPAVCSVSTLVYLFVWATTKHKDTPFTSFYLLVTYKDDDGSDVSILCVCVYVVSCTGLYVQVSERTWWDVWPLGATHANWQLKLERVGSPKLWKTISWTSLLKEGSFCQEKKKESNFFCWFSLINIFA